MARYIDADAITLKVKRYLIPNTDNFGMVGVEDAERYFLKLLEDAPTADVVEVVRCKDCGYYTGKLCMRLLTEFLAFRKPTDFCSRGKRTEKGKIHNG